MKKKLAAFLLAAVLGTAAMTAAVSAEALTPGQDPVNTEVTDETLNLLFTAEPATLWGAATAKLDAHDIYIASALLDTLVQVDKETKEIVPCLASAWEWVDSTHIRFTLRDDVTMTDGSPLVAEDVAYTANVWREQSPATDIGKYILSAEAEDEHNVVIGFTTAAPDLLLMLSGAEFGIVSEDEVNALGGLEAAAKNPVFGTGKYRFKEWKTGEKITLVRNDNYWDPEYKGYFKEINIRFTPDSAARVLAVKSGDVDFALNIPVMEADAAGDDVSEYIYKTGNVVHLWYNMSENAGATKDIRVRQAIHKAINFDAACMVATSSHSGTELSYAGEISPYHTDIWTEEDLAVDVEGAKELLKEAGYENGLELNILGLSSDIPTYTVLQANLAAVGIKLNLDTPDVPQFVEQGFAGKYDLIAIGEFLTYRAPSALSFLVKTNVEGPGMSLGGPKWTTDEIDEKVTEFITATESEKASETLKAIDETLKEEMVYSPLNAEVLAVVTAKDLKGFTFNDLRCYLDITTFYR